MSLKADFFPHAIPYFLTKSYFWVTKKKNFPFQINKDYNSEIFVLGMVTVSQLQVPAHLSDSDL